MFFEELETIRKLAEAAAEREGVPFYILRDPMRRHKAYTAVSSAGFGLPPGLFIEDKINPRNERVEIEPPEKNSTNGF